MRKIATLAMILLLTISIVGSQCLINTVSASSTYTINIGVSEDSTVINLSQSDDNFGDQEELHVALFLLQGFWMNQITFLKFSLNDLPDGANIISASLFLYCTHISSSAFVTSYFVPTDSWSETTITWNTKPSGGYSIGSTMIDTENSWFNWDVSTQTTQEFGGDKILSLALNVGSYPTTFGFASKEYYSYNPYLQITYEGPSVSPPVADFSATPTSGIYPLTVSFADQSTGIIDTYSWNFGDGTTISYAKNPTHEYEVPGTYTVSLTVTGPGGYDTETKTNYITVNDLPHGLIDSDMVETDKLKLSAMIYHDGQENDPDYDFYAVKATLEDKAYKNEPNIGPMFVVITVEMSDFCEEVPSNHKPEAGDHGKVPSQITYTFYFISFNLQIPAYWVDYTESHEGGLYKVEWSLRPSELGLSVSGFLFQDYAEFAIGVRVPKWSKPYATVYAQCVWFKKVWVITHYEWQVRDWDEVGWAVVDSPGADPITPNPPPPMDTPETLYPPEDVAVTSVTASPTSVTVGESVTITVQAENQGDICTFDVTAYYDSTVIGTQTVTNLTSGDSTTLTFPWNTAGVPSGTYNISAEASVVPGETDTADNTYTDGTVTVIAVENIWVNSYTEIERDWTEWGASPWLGDNYWLTMISTSKQKGIHKEFEFQNPTGSGILDVAYLRMRAAGSAELNVGVKIYIWNGVKWVFYWELIPTSKVQQWYTGPDLLGILDTWEKLASAKMYVEMFKTGGPPKYAVACYDCYIRIEYSVPPPDVAVTNVTYALPYGATAVYPGWTVEVPVTVSNDGDFSETFNVTAYANSTIIDTKNVTLAPGQNTTLTFVWTVPTPPAWTPYPPHYTISAEADVVPGETDNADNVFADGSVTVKHPGDANGDGVVDSTDYGLFGVAWPPDGPYNPDCDFNGNGVIDSTDYGILCANYGWFV